MIVLMPGRFYRSAADEVWCCYMVQEGRRFSVVRLRDSRCAVVDQMGRGENLQLIERVMQQNCRECGAAT